MMMASLVRISWVWILSNVVIHTLGFVQLPVESLRRGMTVRSGGYNALIDEKLERNQVKLGTFFDIFSAVDSSFSSAIAPKTETDVYIPISINEAASASSKALDNEKFVVPDTRAWLSSIATLEYTEPPQVVAPPSIVTPPDVITFFKTGVLNSFHEAKVLELYEKTSSLSYLNEQETVKVKEALRVAYVAFFGKIFSSNNHLFRSFYMLPRQDDSSLNGGADKPLPRDGRCAWRAQGRRRCGDRRHSPRCALGAAFE